MRFRLFSVRFLLFVVLLVAAGCERHEGLSFTAEIDEPSYRRAKELLRQGRNQEALSEFQKVIEKRGLNNAPESHLELGLLYQQHIRDPISAIFHYRKYRELKPNSTQAPLVAQRIDAAMREVALTVRPPPPDNQLAGNDMTDVLQRLQQDNEQLKTELAVSRANLNELRSRLTAAQASTVTGNPPAPTRPSSPSAAATEASPVSAPPQDVAAVSPPAGPAPRPNTRLPGTAPATGSARPLPANTPASAARKHVVSKGDTLMSLAQRYYGSRSRYHDIYNANRDVMKSENDVRLGMELKIP